MEKISNKNEDGSMKGSDLVVWECAIKINEIVDWINKYEGAKEEFRQRLLSGNLAGLKMDEKQMEIVRNAKQTEDGELTTGDSLRPETLADPNE